MQTPGSYTFLRLFLFSTALSLLSAASLTAQTTAARPDRGIMPGASYSVSDIENISLTSGNVQLTIPLASLPPMAGGKLKFTVNAVYNSKLWNVTRQENREGQFYGCPSWVVDTPQLSDLGGWRIPFGYRIVFRNAHEDFDYVRPEAPPTPDCETDVQEQLRLQSQYYRVILIGPDGAEHELRPTDSYAPYGGIRPYLLNYYKDIPNSVGGAIRYYSYDGSYLYAVINPSSSSTSWTVYMNDGTRIVQYSNGIQRITDTNGNSIKIFSDANGSHAQDELTGREIRLYNDKVFYKTVTGVEQSIDLVMGSTHVQGKIYQVNDWTPTGGEFGGGAYCTRNDILDTWVPVIREIVFPVTEPGVSARRYTFSYNSDTATANVTDDMRLGCNMPLQPYTRTVSNGMGELSQVATPSGATVTYSYSKTSINNFSFDTNDIPRATVTQKQLTHDGVTDTWTYNITEFAGCGGIVTAPDGSVNTEQCYPHDPAWARFFGYTDDRGGLTYRSRRSDKEMVERHWTMLPFSGANNNLTGSTGVTSFNPVVDVEYRTLLDDTANHNPIKMSATKYQYDFNGNLTQQIDYDWFDPALVSRDVVGVPTGVPVSATVLRTTNYSHYNQAATASSANVYAKRLLSTATPPILNAPRQTTLGSSIVKFSYDGQAFDVAPTVGNLTTKSVFDDLDNKWIATSSTYDVYGNVLAATDGRGKVIQYFYDDTTHALPNRVVVDPQNGTDPQITTTVFDYATGLVTSVTDPNSATSTISYMNQLLNAVDPFGRPGVTTGPLVNAGGTNQHHRVTTTYEDHSLRVIVASDLNSEDDKLLKTRTTTDMLGRTVLVEQTEDGTNYTLYSQQAYAQAGRITLSSSVMRSGTSSSTDSWTRVTNDVLGRVSEVTTFGGATQPPNSGTTAAATGTVATAYNANFTTVTDQAGKVRRSVVDAIGRLIRVDEPDASNNLGTTTAPVQPTNYAYDVFGNLTTVTQGAQTRTFTYDSLSRLRTAVNPESGSIAYQYDDNGNLLVKTDARGVSAHFEYDSLNRIKRRWYNGSNLISGTTHNTPALPAGVSATDEVKFYYDSQVLPTGAPSYTRGATVGRLVAQTYGTSIDGDYYAYDALGRATLKYQQTGSIAYPMSASYNLSGALTTLTYPSNHTVTNTYDQAGRLSAFSGTLGDGTTRTYSTGIEYDPVGGIRQEQFGTQIPLYLKKHYNRRGQLFDIRLSTMPWAIDQWNWNRGAIVNYYSSNYAWEGDPSTPAGPDNNGNVLLQQHWVPANDAISSYNYTQDFYSYDSLNRLQSAVEVHGSPAGQSAQDYAQMFVYDRWGNRTIDPASSGIGINTKQFTVATTNRLGVPAGQPGAMGYDNAGNLTTDTYTGAGNRSYDAENRMITASDNTNQVSRYTYDADGKRVRRQVAASQEEWQVYGFHGELVAEYRATAPASAPEKEYGYRDGQLLITATGRFNVALTANGAVATASSAHTCCGFSTTGAINGNYRGPWGNGEGWNDATPDVVPDWIQVDFAGSKTIDEIDVVSLHDNYTQENTPTETQTFTLYGLLAFDVQYWNGSSWVTIPGGSVTGNNKVWRKFTFTPITTSKIRVWITQVPDSWSRVVEIQAFGTSAGADKVQWLVADHLGTARMIVDQTGNLGSVKRHDYLPFGEELFAPTGGRSAAQGYAGGDGIRQQFTEKERDFETGLDYFEARYYSSTQGRFTSPDEFKGGPQELWILGSGHPEKQALVYADVTNPQSLDKYQYAFNNPLRYVDPDGQKPQDGYELQLRRDEKALREGKMSAAEFQARQNARGVGAAAGAAVVLTAIYGPAAAEAVLLWLARNPDKAEQIVQAATEAAGGPPGLTLAPSSRLTEFERETGSRLAKMLGTELVESAHVGAEYVVAGTTKTIDAMGTPSAYKFWNKGEFLESIGSHLKKSVDYVAIDVKGATASQIAEITSYVNNLPKELRDRVIYVRP